MPKPLTNAHNATDDLMTMTPVASRVIRKIVGEGSGFQPGTKAKTRSRRSPEREDDHEKYHWQVFRLGGLQSAIR